MPDLPAPFLSGPIAVEPGWIDYNGHMNVAYYVVILDRAIDETFPLMGLGESYVAERNGSFFTLGIQVRYRRELRLGQSARVAIHVLEADDKRLRVHQELLEAETGFLAATAEQVFIHVDLGTRRPAPFPADIRARIEAAAVAHAPLPRPDDVGQPLRLKR